MRTLARFLLLLCLLPGLVSGTLPLPGQAAGLEMVICADGGLKTIRLGPDGNPVSPEEDCAQCCVACGSVAADLPVVSSSLRHVLPHDFTHGPAATSVLPPAPGYLFPAPRGPPMPV